MRSSILGTNNNQVLRRGKAENEFTKTTLIFALIHLIMRFFHLFSIFLEFTYYGGYCITLTHLFVMFSLALNLPILYKFNSKFRKSAKELLVQKSNS
jgi:preprotein translocase subunit SecG